MSYQCYFRALLGCDCSIKRLKYKCFIEFKCPAAAFPQLSIVNVENLDLRVVCVA